MTAMSNTKLKKRRPADKSKIAFFSLFCLPPLLLYILFCVYPIFSSLYTSFFEWSGYDALTKDNFVGFQNYIQVITDSEFLAAIKNDFIIILGKEIIIIVLTILFAVSLTRLRFSKLETGIYRFIFFMPNVLSVIIISTIWTFVLDPNFGILNPLLKGVGLSALIPEMGWTFTHPIGVITFVASWCGIGLFMLIMITAINGISKELYESATIDGAGEWTQLRYITMPAVWEQAKFMVITILYQSFSSSFTMVQAMLGSSVSEDSVVMGVFVYKNSFDSQWPQVGYSYAAAILMLIISAAASFIVNRIMSRGDSVNE